MSEGVKFQSFRVSQVVHDEIVEYIDTGELDPDIPPLGVSVSKVVWSPEMSSMNVFWQLESDNVEKRDQVKNILNSKAKKLRAHLIERRLSGHIPVIQFVWDKSQRSKFHLAYIDKMLAMADYGPDHKPEQDVTHSAEMDSPVLQASPKLLEKIQRLSTKKDPNALPQVEDIEKSFSDDIYGLERNQLLASIKDSKDKLEAGLKKREKRLQKNLKRLKLQQKDVKTGKDKQEFDLSRTKDFPIKRVSEMQKLVIEEGQYLEKLEQSEDKNFLEDEWSDDDDEEDFEVNIITQMIEKDSIKSAESFDADKINESQLQQCDIDNNTKGNLDSGLKTESHQTPQRHGLKRSSLSSPLRVREMQRYISEGNMEDTDDLDLMKSEWSDDEKSENR